MSFVWSIPRNNSVPIVCDNIKSNNAKFKTNKSTFTMLQNVALTKKMFKSRKMIFNYVLHVLPWVLTSFSQIIIVNRCKMWSVKLHKRKLQFWKFNLINSSIDVWNYDETKLSICLIWIVLRRVLDNSCMMQYCQLFNMQIQSQYGELWCHWLTVNGAGISIV